ncbi:MAG: sulfatase-like hydrolase/transferase [Nitrospirota bacterium]
MAANSTDAARGGSLKTAAVFAVLAVYFYLFMEWLFFATKPSFLSASPLSERLAVLVLAPLPLAVPSLAVILIVFAAAAATRARISRAIAESTALLVPAAVFSSSLFMLVDNFTYTLFHVGVSSLTGGWRLAYGIFFVALCVVVYRALGRAARRPTAWASRGPVAMGAGGLLLLSLVAAAFTYDFDGGAASNDTSVAHATTRPNILLVGADGLNADHLSAYGYERDTTPFLRSLVGGALVADNAFTNVGHTGGAIAALLTGKAPARTRLIYPPDILRGRDAYEHLPGMLKQLGYHTRQLSMRHYGDAYDLNLRDAFDESNFRSLRAVTWAERAILGHSSNSAYVSSLYFLEQVYGRLEERVLHAFGVRTMTNPFAEVQSQTGITDGHRIAALLKFLGRPPEPYFVHAHFLGSHGPMFSPYERRFSTGKPQDAPWLTDFYDDAIAEFDVFVRYIIEDLRTRDQLRNTVVVLYSDHGMRWKPDVRVPLLFLFPDQRYAGRVSDNAQLLDIAPTLLDYMDIEPPGWMTGHSLLRPGSDRLRPIFMVSNDPNTFGEGRLWQKALSRPPFYGLGVVYAAVCQRLARLDVTSNVFMTSDVTGHTAPCDESQIPDQTTIRGEMVNHLRSNGYDVSSLQPAVDDDARARQPDH